MSITADAYPKAQDERIRQDVMHAIGWHPEIRSKDISVKVIDGNVSLTGFVHGYLEKTAAQSAAKRIFGVQSVANDIEVKPAYDRTDPEIARDVNDALRIHSGIPHEKIKVLVNNGFVTLEGELLWDFQRRNAEKAATSPAGVKGVINMMTIQPVASPRDVREKIEDAWKRTIDLDARRMSVAADGGTVTLSGSVHSFNELEEAEFAAWQAPGVRQVVNHLHIAV